MGSGWPGFFGGETGQLGSACKLAFYLCSVVLVACVLWCNEQIDRRETLALENQSFKVKEGQN